MRVATFLFAAIQCISHSVFTSAFRETLTSQTVFCHCRSIACHRVQHPWSTRSKSLFRHKLTTSTPHIEHDLHAFIHSYLILFSRRNPSHVRPRAEGHQGGRRRGDDVRVPGEGIADADRQVDQGRSGDHRHPRHRGFRGWKAHSDDSVDQRRASGQLQGGGHQLGG